MTNAPAPSPRPGSLVRALLGDKHFIIATVILVVAAAGWGAATRWLKLATIKERVPWPAGARVSDAFQLASLPDRLGPYRRYLPSEVPKPREGNVPDWEAVRSGDLETLGIGTSADRDELPYRKSNWYVIRRYVDVRSLAAVRLWQLDVYYYTGGADTVPHIPDICAQAGGATIVASDSATFDIPRAPEGWPRAISLHRTRYSMPEGFASASYYVFSMNGAFMEDRLVVRRRLLNPFIRHAYFAKIQFSPIIGTTDPAQMDRAAEEFLQAALPEIMKALPSRADVEALGR
jgi:hypothetical protein